MTERTSTIAGYAAAIRIDNLDTDQIMPKQFLRGIDKSGLAKGLLYDLRFDANGEPRSDFVLNRVGGKTINILIGGSNFGCGSSREHAVWGLQQYGIQAVIAPSFGEIFYSNAMNNRLMLVMLSVEQVEFLMHDTEGGALRTVSIDVERQLVLSQGLIAPFELSPRHRLMFLERLDVIGLTLKHQNAIDAFARDHWQRFPWLENVAQRTASRLIHRTLE